MNIQDFTSLLKEPCNITTAQTAAVEDILNNYPYFQAAHVLYLKGLKKKESFKYNKALRVTAAHTTNRTVLFDFITNDTLNLAKKEHIEKRILQEAEVIDIETIAPPEKIKTQEKVSIPILETLQIGKPLDFNKSEKHSFTEWLQLTTMKPIARENIASKTKETVKNEVGNFDLINQFLAAKPKIKPEHSSTTVDVSQESISVNESLMTETLARVYLEQKKYAKAIKAFKILSLKYPEKSGFFADRIKAVKFLQQHNT